jgi:uncharacterized protein (DUF433 family)
MRALRDRLVASDGQACLRATATSVAEVVGRLAKNEPPVKLIAPGGLTAADVVAALAQTALGDDDAEGPPLVQARPQFSGLLQSLSEPAWVAVFPGAPHRSRLCLAAGLLQIHDFWEASHDAAQRADDQGERVSSAYWHGIAHRREPDAGNAAYWFRRVGKHPNFTSLAEEARLLLDRHGEFPLGKSLISGGEWNATAMIDVCTKAKPGTPDETLARRLQRLEMWLLLESTYAAIAG